MYPAGRFNDGEDYENGPRRYRPRTISGGVAFDPTTGHYHVFEPATQMLYELSEEGRIESSRDLSEIAHRRPYEGMLFAPSADRTDAPSQHNLYLIDGPAPAYF